MQLFVEHLTVIDCAYLSEADGLVGESWITDVTLTGRLDAHSMIMDFAHVKKQIKQAIDTWADHTLIVPTESPALTLRSSGNITELTFGFVRSSAKVQPHRHEVSEGKSRSEREQRDAFPVSEANNAKETLFHTSPAEALCLLPAAEVTAETVARYLEARLMEVVPETVERIDITLRTEPTDAPYYHYVHGLKKHDGNCQRIAHGHRSRLRIERNGQYDDSLTHAWAARFATIYIGTREDIVSSTATHTDFAYDAPQGHYALSYPTALCYVIDSDSTVECIATHIAECCKQEYPNDRFTVRAYEGVMKGAIASA